jgi:ADP-ribose pyrophosphatase YjhB (NUDIX family)
MLLNLEHLNKKANDIHEGKWNGLGGKFEAGETPEKCVIREVYEESGLLIREPKLCGLLVFPRFKGNDWYVFVFTADDFSGELIDSPEASWNGYRMKTCLTSISGRVITSLCHGFESVSSFPQSLTMRGIRCVDMTWCFTNTLNEFNSGISQI